MDQWSLWALLIFAAIAIVVLVIVIDIQIIKAAARKKGWPDVIVSIDWTPHFGTDEGGPRRYRIRVMDKRRVKGPYTCTVSWFGGVRWGN